MGAGDDVDLCLLMWWRENSKYGNLARGLARWMGVVYVCGWLHKKMIYACGRVGMFMMIVIYACSRFGGKFETWNLGGARG